MVQDGNRSSSLTLESWEQMEEHVDFAYCEWSRYVMSRPWDVNTQALCGERIISGETKPDHAEVM